jgi:hypothetical protein
VGVERESPQPASRYSRVALRRGHLPKHWAYRQAYGQAPDILGSSAADGLRLVLYALAHDARSGTAIAKYVETCPGSTGSRTPTTSPDRTTTGEATLPTSS